VIAEGGGIVREGEGCFGIRYVRLACENYEGRMGRVSPRQIGKSFLMSEISESVRSPLRSEEGKSYLCHFDIHATADRGIKIMHL
jgi:hypothetical protein